MRSGLAEHHFTDYSVCPSVHMIGVQVAERTRRLRIGTAVSLAAFYHPLRLAEEVALLDVLSEGRVNWGPDGGSIRTSSAPSAFRSPRAGSGSTKRSRSCWRRGAASASTGTGATGGSRGSNCFRSRINGPHPPVWVASGSPDAIAWAGRRGLMPMLGPHSTFDGLNAMRTAWEEALAGAGRSAPDQDMPVARLLAVAPTDAEAEETVRRGAAWMVDTYKNESKGTANPTERRLADGTVVAVDPVEGYLDDIAIWGSPERVVDQIAELRERIGLHYLMCAPLSHGSFMTFVERVLPRFL